MKYLKTYEQSNVTKLDYSGQNLSELPELPEGLTILHCNSNQLPFDRLKGYNEWYKENEYLIKTQGLSYAYELSNSINKYNV